MKKFILFLVGMLALTACQTPPTPPADTTAPTTPQAFKATAGNSKVKLEWQTNTEVDLKEYKLHWGSSASQQNALETIPKTSSSFDLTGINNGTTYFFKLEAVDTVGNVSISTSLLSATPTAPDTTAPQLSSSVPALNSSSIALNTQVQLTFSRAMNIATVAVSSSNLTLGAATWSAGNTAVSFVTPALNLETTYTLQLSGKDVAGNALSGATSLQFSTISAPPTILSTTPNNNATNMSISSTIGFNFSKSMNKTNVENAFSSIPAITCTWTWLDSDQTAICTPKNNLEYQTNYVLTLTASASSATGINLGNPVTLNFSTLKDTTQPALVSFTPLDAAINVLYNTAIVLNFSKAMNQTSVQNSFQSQPAIVCNWTWTTPSSASCQPVERFNEFTQYQITLGISATDLVGNPMQTAYGFSFSVGKAPPKIISVTPANNARNVATNTPIVITFSGVVVRETAEAALQVKVGTTVKTGNFTWNSECVLVSGTFYVGCKQMTFTPSSPYPTSSDVTWSVGTGVMDFTNLNMENEVVGGFQTPLVFGGI